MTLQKSFALLFALLVGIGAQAAPAADNTDPYNTYMWNRDNALAHNGQTDVEDWYEWWYYKVVDPKSGEAFFFTYGIVNPWDQDGSLAGTGAGMQAGNFSRHLLFSNHFELSQFMAYYDRTEVHIANNWATEKELHGDLSEKGHHISWNLSLTKNWSFDAMGWTMKSKLSNIYWYPAQAAATMTGTIQLDDQTFSLDHAPAYQDRNWGKSFPKWWTWLTSNGFKNFPDTVLAVGGGAPKVMGTIFISGLCIGLRHQGHEYVFRTTDGDDIDFKIGWGIWEVSATNSENERIEISAHAPSEKFMLLSFPAPRGSLYYDYEALTGNIKVKLYKRDNIFADWKKVADLETDNGGIEWGSPTPINSITDLPLTTPVF